MALYQILYWQEIPSQIKVWDDFDEIKVELNPEIAARIDAAAQSRGFTTADAYSAQWKWSEEQERDGAPDEVAQALKTELETKWS
jgi:hypothetical protein